MKLRFIIFKMFPGKTAFAHCDIPCGIYDPHHAQLAAHTIIRMTQLISGVERENETKAEHDIARMTHVKEEHAQILEEELETLRNDYFKEEHFKKFPKLRGLFEKALKASSKARQNIDMQSADEALETVLQIAEIFYQTKSVSFARVKSVYPTEREIVVQK